MGEVVALPLADGWGDPVGSPTALLRHLYPEHRPEWLVSPWRWSDGQCWTYAVEPGHLDAIAVRDLHLLTETGFEVRIDAVPATSGPRLLVQLQRTETVDDR